MYNDLKGDKVNMSKNNMYNDLVENGIFEKIDIEDTRVYENDIVIESKYMNDSKKYKIVTDDLTNEEIIISLIAKQNLYLKKIINILLFSILITIIGIIISFI